MNHFRSLFLLCLLSLALVAVALATTTKKTIAPAPKPPPKAETFSGTSDKGDFEDALNQAVNSAIESRHVADAMIEWKLKSVSGVNGGVAGFRKLTVSIEAKPR